TSHDLYHRAVVVVCGECNSMRHTIVYVSAALVTFGIAAISAAADDRETCSRQAEEAIAACGRLISRNPGDAVSYTNRGHAYWSKNDNDHALADFNQAIRLDPKNAFVYADRGYLYLGKGDNDHAIADLDQAIRLDPKSGTVYAGRGEAYLNRRDNDHAIAD